MSFETRLVVPAQVIHQMIEDEVILVHLERGTYHSLRGSGAAVFTALAAGTCARDVARRLAAETDGSADEIDASLARFVDELLRVGLVIVDADATPVASVEPGTVRRAFEPPGLETFTDLQDLLTADPIHDVAQAGWPALDDDKRRK